MLSNDEYNKLLKKVKEEFPTFRMLKKSESKLMKAIDFFLKKITFGKMTTFMDSFITTIGTTVYVPENWDKRSPSTKAITIRHERVHMRQADRFGNLRYSLMYLFLPFPIGIAYYRMKFEKEAYMESMQAGYEYYGSKIFTKALKEDVVNHFTSAEYFWMWPWKKSVENWYDGVVERITKKEKLLNS